MVFQIVHRDCRNHNRRFLRSLGFALVNKEILEDIGAVQRVVHTEVDTFENICHTILVNKGLYNLKLVPGVPGLFCTDCLQEIRCLPQQSSIQIIL